MTSEDLPPEIGALLASLTEQTPSNDASAVLGAALTARSAAPLQLPPTDNEAAAFARAVDDVAGTLELLTSDDWGRPSVNGLTVGELVGHLIGTQLSMVAELGLDVQTATPASTSTDHIESTRDAITAGSRLSPTEAAAEFVRVSNVLTTHLARLDDQGLAAQSRFGSIVADLSFLLVVRIFELWTHDNDLRHAVGRDRIEPDPDRLWMMTHTVMPVVNRIGGDRLRIVLTGPGGDVWPAQGEEIAEVAIDSVAFCRRAANRIPLDLLNAEISGDTAAANKTLDDLATLALD